MSLNMRKLTRVEKLKARYGEDYFKRIGSKGGKNSPVRGFEDPEVASRAGKISKRKKS